MRRFASAKSFLKRPRVFYNLSSLEESISQKSAKAEAQNKVASSNKDELNESVKIIRLAEVDDYNIDIIVNKNDTKGELRVSKKA